MKFVVLSVIVCLGLAGCQSAAEQAGAIRQSEDARSGLTVGTMQRAIRVGMSGSEVAEMLGSPNMVTTDELRREVWVYDRVSTESVSSSSAGGASILLLGISGGASAHSTSQRTLTIVVKFDTASRVRDFSYRSSSF